MSHIAAFSKYLAYQTGGAEISTFNLLQKEADKGVKITLLSTRNASFLGEKAKAKPIPEKWNLTLLPFGKQFNKFSFIEYAVNRSWLVNWFSKFQANELWTYGMWAPAAAMGFQGQVKYFIRSETDLGIAGNYFQGFKRWAKHAYILSEYPAATQFRKDLANILPSATVVANSRYIASLAKERFGVDSQIILPPIDIAPLRRHLDARISEEKWIIFVGDSFVKGLGLVQEVARLLPNHKFKIFSRFVSSPNWENNIYWCPWQSEIGRIYEDARLVIVPSQWQEAYGRVAREAFLLNIPVLVSQTGGLAEAVDFEENCLVQDFRSVSAWKGAICAALSR